MDVTALREQFPVTKQWTFLDHAAVAAPPLVAANSLADWAEDKSRNGIVTYAPWAARVEQARRNAGELINADPQDVCFVGSTTHGIGIFAEGYPWVAGDNVITFAEEYPSNQYPWINLRDRGVEVRVVESRGNRIEVDDVRAMIDNRTRLLAVSSVEFASGHKNNLISIGELCRSNNIFFFVDAIQSLGVQSMDVQQLPIDGLAADGHKWMLGPEGAGIAYVRREWVDRLHATGVGWNSVVNAIEFSTIDFRMKPNAGRWEGGTVNVGGIVAMGESIRLLLDVGIGHVWQRVDALTTHLCERAPAVGIEVFSNREPGRRSGIVSLLTPGRDPKTIMRACRDAGVVVNVRGGRLRVSPHVYNTIEEIDRFLAVVADT